MAASEEAVVARMRARPQPRPRRQPHRVRRRQAVAVANAPKQGTQREWECCQLTTAPHELAYPEPNALYHHANELLLEYKSAIGLRIQSFHCPSNQSSKQFNSIEVSFGCVVETGHVY